MAINTLRSKPTTKVFLDLLISRKLVKEAARQALAGRELDEVERYLRSRHLVAPEELAKALADFFHLPFVRLTNQPIKKEVVQLIPESVARRWLVVPYSLDGFRLKLAVGEPAKLEDNAPSELVKLCQRKGLRVELAVALDNEVKALINKVYAPTHSSHPPVAEHKTESRAELHKEVATHPKPESQPINPTTNPVVSKPSPVVTKEAAPVQMMEEKVEKPIVVTDVKPPTDNLPQSSIITPLPIVANPATINQPVKPPPGQSAGPPSLLSSPIKQKQASQIEFDAPPVDVSKIDIPLEALKKIPRNVAEKYQIIVFDVAKPRTPFEPEIVKVAIVNPNDLQVREILTYIEEKNRISLDRYTTTKQSFDQALKHYDKVQSALKEEIVVTGDTVESVDKKPLVQPAPAAAANPVSTPPQEVKVGTGLPSVKTAPVAKTSTIKLSDDLENPTIVAPDEIINRPSAETGGGNEGASPKELERLANEQQSSAEERNLDRLLRGPVESAEDLAKVFRSGVIPEIVAGTVFLALRMKASDIHVEAEQEFVRVRFRIDGILHDVVQVPAFLHAPLVSRIKILSKMKIDEQRVPQDGRFDVVIDSRQVDIRVSTLPTVHGEKVVMRLLDKSSGVLSLEQLGVTGSNFDILVRNIGKPYGIILVTGPTGSGKSTTLYAVLTRISKPNVNIITLEDPVEYELPGLNQAQVKPQIGFTFAEGLRSVLRQDPNIIMVGEIRDLETAAMATHAALTGHLVLSTLHTNDAAGALPRLINMGVEPFLITSSINAVVGQRLVRKVCDQCRESVKLPGAVMEYIKRELSALPGNQAQSIDMNNLVFYHGKGCANCNNGYSGRIGIYETLEMSAKIEELSVKRAPASEIKTAAIKAGMITMSQDGILKALKGITTIDEILRVTTTDIKEVPGVGK